MSDPTHVVWSPTAEYRVRWKLGSTLASEPFDRSPMQNPAPTELDEALSPQWLSSVLSTPSQPVEVTAVRVVETFKTKATKVRFEVEAPGAPETFNRALCVKGFFGGDHLAKVSAMNSQS